MVKITAFDWDNLYITPDEDPAYAGDKEPNSVDDKECGDHFIPKWKDCHDGGAHRPEPGENPYWTDENSADERRDNDIPWDTNKPKSREERDKETEWHDPEEEVPELPEEEEVVPEPEPEPEPEEIDDEDYYDPEEEDYYQQQEEERDASEEAIEAVPEGQWARQKDMVAKALSSLQAVLVRGPQGNAKALALQEAAKDLQSDNRYDNLKAVSALQNAVGEARELLADPNINKILDDGSDLIMGPKNAIRRADSAQFALDVFHSSIRADDPRDIQAWDKLRRRPETLEPEDLLQLSDFDTENIPEEDLQSAYSAMEKMSDLLNRWRETPSIGGADLAKLFMDDPDGPMTPENMSLRRAGLPLNEVEKSPFETNTKLAMAILDRSARAGDNDANKMLWESFGLSEEWSPDTYLYDHQKAAGKATKEMKQWADWSGIDSAQSAYMLAGADWAEAESAQEEFDKEYQDRKKAILDYRDGGDYDASNPDDKNRFLKAISDLEDDKDDIDRKARRAHQNVLEANEKIFEEAQKIREPIKNALRHHNQYNQVDADTAGEILSRVKETTWAEIDENDDDYTPGKGKGRAGLSGAKLRNLRWKHRDQPSMEKMDASSQYPNAAKIQESLQDLISICHRDVMGSANLKNISWESEVMVRAYASSHANTICLSVGADLKKVPKHEMYDTTRKHSKGAYSDREDIAIHEFSHHMEFNSTDTANRFADFYRRRTEGQPIIKKGDIDPRTGDPYRELEHFDDDEEFIPDHFFTTYCGKLNNGQLRVGHTELVSMGVQALYNKDLWGEMVRDDPEHMALIIATLRGY